MSLYATYIIQNSTCEVVAKANLDGHLYYNIELVLNLYYTCSRRLNLGP